MSGLLVCSSSRYIYSCSSTFFLSFFRPPPYAGRLDLPLPACSVPVSLSQPFCAHCVQNLHFSPYIRRQCFNSSFIVVCIATRLIWDLPIACVAAASMRGATPSHRRLCGKPTASLPPPTLSLGTPGTPPPSTRRCCGAGPSIFLLLHLFHHNWWQTVLRIYVRMATKQRIQESSGGLAGFHNTSEVEEPERGYRTFLRNLQVREVRSLAPSPSYGPC